VKPSAEIPQRKSSPKDELKSMPMAELETKLESSPDGLSQAEAGQPAHGQPAVVSS
jgi:H+-transporting ATPase